MLINFAYLWYVDEELLEEMSLRFSEEFEMRASIERQKNLTVYENDA